MSSSDSGTIGKLLLPALGLAIAVVILVYGCTYVGWETERTPDALAELALTGGSADVQQQAAAELADFGAEATPQLRQVLKESNSPGVKALVIDGLGKIPDYESMDAILAALDDPSAMVRGRAAKQVRDMLGRSFPYDANAPQEERAKMIAAMGKEWESVKGTELFRQYQERRQRESGKPKTINIRTPQGTP